MLARGGRRPEAEDLCEFAGRVCYGSFDLPNPITATNRGYLANILEKGHFSVLEHGSASLYIQGISRACSHEIVRHRMASYSQLSQRYKDVTEDDVAIHPDLTSEAQAVVRQHQRESVDKYDWLVGAGVPKQAARMLLPNATSTELVMTANHRSWRHFLARRGSKYADPEIRAVACIIAGILKLIEPNIYQDVKVDSGRVIVEYAE